MNLIRNGGFELADDTFWENIGDGTFTVENVGSHRGLWGGVIAVDAWDAVEIRSTDFLEVSYGSMYLISSWVRLLAGMYAYVKVWEYDSDLNEISELYLSPYTSTLAWQLVGSRYAPAQETAYIKVGIYIYVTTTAGDIYLDDMNACEFDINHSCLVESYIATLIDRTTNGNTKNERIYPYGLETYRAEMEVTAVAGVNPTLDIGVYEVDKFENERLLGTFAQGIAVTDERINLTKPSGNGIFAKYVIGGTNPEFTFNVTVTGVR